MPSARNRLTQQGFSLIELLVVVLIIGLGVGLASLSVGTNDSAYLLRTQAKQFANHASIVADEAVLGGRQWGVDIYRDVREGEDVVGYRFLQRDDDQWWPVAPLELTADRELPPGISIEFTLEGVEQEVGVKQEPPVEGEIEPSKLQPDVWLLSSGEVTPFVLTLSSVDNPAMTIIVRADLLGRISLDESDDSN